MSDILDEYGSLEWDEDEDEEEEEYSDEEGYVPSDEWMDESWVDESDEEASKRAKRRRRAAAARKARRRRQLAAARKKRRRGPVRKARTPRTAKAAISKTRQDLKEVALENEVRDGAIGGALGSLNQQVRGLHRSVAAAPAVNIAQNRITDVFPTLDANGQKIVSDGLAIAPALLLSGKARKEQIFGLIAGLVIGIGGEISRRVQDDDKGAVKIVRDFGDIPEGLTVRLTTNKNGGETWTSSDTNVATVDAKTGVVTGVKYGSANITATVGTEFDVVLVTVVKAGGASGSTSK